MKKGIRSLDLCKLKVVLLQEILYGQSKLLSDLAFFIGKISDALHYQKENKQYNAATD